MTIILNIAQALLTLIRNSPEWNFLRVSMAESHSDSYKSTISPFISNDRPSFSTYSFITSSC